MQAAGIVEHDGKRAVEESVVAIDADASQQDFLFLTYYISDVVDDANVVVADNAKGDGILAAALSCPFRPNYSVTETLTKLWRVGTILAMNLDATATCHEAKDGIAINWLTAFCHLEVKTFQVLVDDEDIRPTIPLYWECFIRYLELVGALRGSLLLGFSMVETLLLGIGFEDGIHVELPISQGSIEVRYDAITELRHGMHQDGLLVVELLILHLALQFLFCEECLPALHFLEALADLCTCSGCREDVQPVLFGRLIAAGQYFNLVAAL